MLEARAADRNLYLVIKSNITEPVVNDERGVFRKDRRSRRTGLARVDQQRSSTFKSHHNYSRLRIGEKPAHVGGGDAEREGEKLELNEPELKINFCSVENQRLDSISHTQRSLQSFTHALSKVKSPGVAPVSVSTALIQGRQRGSPDGYWLLRIVIPGVEQGQRHSLPSRKGKGPRLSRQGWRRLPGS